MTYVAFCIITHPLAHPLTHPLPRLPTHLPTHHVQTSTNLNKFHYQAFFAKTLSGCNQQKNNLIFHT